MYMTQLYTDDDHLLWQKIREGSVESFRLLYDKYWKEVYLEALKKLRNRDQAEDISQDIFANLWMKRQEFQIANLPAYLHMSVRNRVLDMFEKEKRYIPFEELLNSDPQTDHDRADGAVLRHEFLSAYKALVEELPAQRKKIFRLHYDEGLSTEEIAGELQLSRKTIQNQLGRAVSFLKANLSHLVIWAGIFWLGNRF
jgi:RNA polymerase sigma-70 factor (ECF subfamily)